MRFTACAIAALLIIGCSAAPPLENRAKQRAAPTEVAAPPVAPAAPVAAPAAPTFPNQPPTITRQTVDGVTFEGVSFDSRSHRLIVKDQPAGPGSQFPDAAAAGQSAEGLAAINAGFFTLEGDPLGLVVANGTSSGFWNATTSLGSGIWRQDASGNLSITRREKLGRAAAGSQRELIQAGPMLLENGHSILSLESTKSAVRSILLWDGGNRWWLGLTSPCTLAEVTGALSHASPGGWHPKQALNLDGGRSSDLWISSQVSGGPLNRRPPWNKQVRNFLVLVAR